MLEKEFITLSSLALWELLLLYRAAGMLDDGIITLYYIVESKILEIPSKISSVSSHLPYLHYTGYLIKMVIELWSALARSLYDLQKSFFHSRKDQAFSFRMSPFL